MSITEKERLTRWRLILGGGQSDGTGQALSGEHIGMDRVLAQLYGEGDGYGTGIGGGPGGNSPSGGAGLGASSPKVVKGWLGDIRQYFPKQVVQVMQKDAYENLNLDQMLLEPETLELVESDVHLVATLMSLKNVIPSKTKATARKVVSKVVEDLQKKLQQPMINAIKGALNRSIRNPNPKLNEINWDATIRANLKHYMPEYKTVIPQKLIGYGRKSQGTLKDIILCIDQSGSMATSVIYSSIFGAVMASIKAVSTQMVVFDTAVADLTEDLDDPIDLLFGAQLGGGTDINRAVKYCQGLIRKPQDTILILITDLYEGGNQRELIKRAAKVKESGVQLITLLALSDEGKPGYDQNLAGIFGKMGIPCFACTPELFPDLMAAAINKQDLNKWSNSVGLNGEE